MMRSVRPYALMLTLLAATPSMGAPATAPADAPMYQWSLAAPVPDGKSVGVRVWIPPSAPRIRGVLIGTISSLTDDPAIRRACEVEELAILRPSLGGTFNYKEGPDAESFLSVLKTAADATGYKEIAVAPYFTFGHSVGCNYATSAGCWKPDRTFGILVFKGGLVFPPAFDPQADITGIPILAIGGQFEEFGSGPSGVLRDFEDRDSGWKESRRRYLDLRERNERMLISLCVEAGTTHMAWSPRDGEYVALFIRKAAKARIPDWPVDATEPVRCKPIDVTTGALTTTAITNPHAPKPANYADYKADRRWTYWHVDLELAQAWDAYHAGRFNKRTQYVTFADPATGKAILSRHDLRFDAKPQWISADTFKVAGTFLTEVRDRYPVPEQPIGHAQGPIQFRLFGGSGVEQVGPDTFRVRAYSANGTTAAITAFHPGDDTYRYAEQPARLKLDAITKGKAQTITFPAIGPLKPGAAVKLAAASDSGLPVAYVVGNGPAAIEDGVLRISGIPPKAKLPLSIKVTAYQWGSAVEPFVQTAAPVSQTVEVAP